jgi:hypothetical protein
MVEENILPVIDKLTSAGVTFAELKEIKSLIDTDDFIQTFNLVNALEPALQPTGKELLRNEIKEAAKQYHRQAKIINLKNISRITMPTVAASVAVACFIFIYQNANNYNGNRNKYSLRYKKNAGEEIKKDNSTTAILQPTTYNLYKQ